MIQMLLPISPREKPYPDFPVDTATQIKLLTAIAMMAFVGRGPGDFPNDQAINYRKLSFASIRWLKTVGIPADRDFAPLGANYLFVFDGGRKFPDPASTSVIYSRILHCLVIETQLLVAIQYFHGMGLYMPGNSLSLWSQILSPEEFADTRMATLTQADLRELRGRVFFEYGVVMIRAQWDKLVRLACTIFGLRDRWNSVSDGLGDLQEKTAKAELNPFCRQHLNFFLEIATDRLKVQDQGGWLKPYRDNLLHFVGGHSAGVIPQAKSFETTSQLWEHVLDEHHWFREAFMSLMIVFLTIAVPAK